MQITLPELPGRAEHPQPRVPARPHAVPDELPASAPIKSFEEAYDYLKAHPQEGLKYGDTRIGPSSTYHLENADERAEYEAVKAFEIPRAKAYLDNLLDQRRHDDDLDAVLQSGSG